ncbi:ABC transporter ATP-binding protein [Streptococcus macedonicus]|uniref:ABC-type quaternary amine transporter n=1 Tax=Streptococcus macedonicus TaxID=59310 RepID=A0AA47FAL0_STRMC|nr:ABC transporter ATP-binding protein [Streptococcus macedonicus]MCW8485282.1 ABC transporter ATP-binding protein [Streptococcus macedonicus]MCW8493504.1 ABC transporter ATP-binding protein [Streptococcus macedonicus]MCW8498757.1 ABC transporter ATP-binding protein [Streptococcus macedonicus]MCW8500740.1 ABC transporter ATP-binding protein [Streptococcus macedonicus]MCW8503277.1 ABC transporter ATP-binding protein [Streptococcus macedonicus]
MTEKTMIQFEHISKVYGDKTVVNDINLTIENGEFITILGTSGSGKTTMLKMINKLIEPTSGTILFAGQDIEQMDSVSLRRQIGYVVQQIGLFPHMTVAENIATVPKLLGWNKGRIENRVGEFLDLVQLPAADYAERYPSELSGGQQQRIGVARALAADPDVMLFDEPFGAIDAITRNDLQEELQAIHQKLNQKTFIFITHDIYEAFKLGTRVVIMDNGIICQFDTPENIIKNPGNEFVQKLITTAQEQEKLWRTSYD